MLHSFFFKIGNNNVILQEGFRCALKIAYCEFFPPHCTNSMAFRNIPKLYSFGLFFFFKSFEPGSISVWLLQRSVVHKKKPNPKQRNNHPPRLLHCCEVGSSQFTNIVRYSESVRQKSLTRKYE